MTSYFLTSCILPTPCKLKIYPEVVRTKRTRTTLQPPSPSSLPSVAYNHWKPLHTKQEPTPEWFEKWKAMIPCSSCREDFFAYLLTNPPRYNDWFAWTVEAHNWVNVKLKRTKMTIEEAALIWL